MLMLAAISYFMLYQSGNAVPLSSPVYSSETFLQRHNQAIDLCPRKTLEIIWSCVATILASSWVSVHPNLPHPDDSKIKRTLRRVGLMFWAIIVPELIVFWAMRQWAGARSMEKRFTGVLYCCVDLIIIVDKLDLEYLEEKNAESMPGSRLRMSENKIKWTRTHGFFLQMGGFMLHETGKEPRVIGWKKLLEHHKAGRIDLSIITEARIQDHSKADGLAKGLALIQTFWFITQCIARFFDENFVLTEFELVTAALAVVSLVIYFLWWNKPFNAEIPIVITLTDQLPGCPYPDDSNSNQEAPTSQCSSEGGSDTTMLVV